MTALTRVLIFAAVLPQSLQRQSLLRAARALRLVLAPGFGGGAWGSLDSFVSCRADLFLCAVCAVGRRRVTYYSA